MLLCRAIRSGMNEDSIMDLINHNNLNQLDMFYDNPILHLACDYKMLNVCNKLIDLGADLNFQCYENYSLLLNAIYNGLKDIVIKMIEKGANVNHVSKNGYTAFGLCIIATRFTTDDKQIIIKKLIDYGGDITIKDWRGYTALELFYKHNLTEVIEYVKSNYLEEILAANGGNTPLSKSYSNPIADLNTIDIIISFIV